MGWPVHSYGTEQFFNWRRYKQGIRREDQERTRQEQAQLEQRMREVKQNAEDRKYKQFDMVNKAVDTYRKLYDSDFSPSELRSFRGIMQNQLKAVGVDIDLTNISKPEDVKDEWGKVGVKQFINAFEYYKEHPYEPESANAVMRGLGWLKANNKQFDVTPYQNEFQRIQTQQAQEAKAKTEKQPSQLEAGKAAGQLRKEFEAQEPVKQFREISFRYDVMQEAMREATTTKNFVAVDQAIITTFNKMTDPDSVVRESEYIRTSSDLSLWNRLKGKIERFKAGGPGLTSQDREALFRMAKKFMAAAQRRYNIEKMRYEGFFKQSGLSPAKHFYPQATRPPTTRKNVSDMTDEELLQELMKLRGQQ